MYLHYFALYNFSQQQKKIREMNVLSTRIAHKWNNDIDTKHAGLYMSSL